MINASTVERGCCDIDTARFQGPKITDVVVGGVMNRTLQFRSRRGSLTSLSSVMVLAKASR